MDVAAMLREAEAAVHQAMRDRTWEPTPIGQQVKSYLRVLRWSSESRNTHDAYEQVLGLLALRHADWGGLDDFCSPAGPEYLREFLDAEWGTCSAATKKQRTSIVRSFFSWAALEKRIPWDPAYGLKGPRVRSRAARQAYPLEVLHTLVSGQQRLREQVCVQLLCRLGLRKDELRCLRYRDVDLIRGYVLVHGKGAKDELIPLVGSLADDLRLLWAETNSRPDDYVLAPLGRPGPMNPATVHRWFKRCLEAAGLPETVKMHEMRHSAADAVYRQRGDVAMAQMLLRHESLSTTQAYLHPTKTDLAETLRALDAIWTESN
jgi:site-specific recombinase XerD